MKREGVLGSPEKDILNSSHFKVIGAEVNSGEAARSRGLVCVSAPVTKRLSLIALSLRAASLPITSRGLISRLAGCWTNVLMYRRCLVCVLSEIYKLGIVSGGSDEEVLTLRRSVANEIVLASVFGLIAASDVSVPYDKTIYATDASMKKGAVVSRDVGIETAKALWLGGDKKGAYTKLDNPFRAVLRAVGVHDDEDDLEESEKSDMAYHGCDLQQPSFSFDFCEICGGSGVVSKEAAALGLSVCTTYRPVGLKTFRPQELQADGMDQLYVDGWKNQNPSCVNHHVRRSLLRRTLP